MRRHRRQLSDWTDNMDLITGITLLFIAALVLVSSCHDRSIAYDDCIQAGRSQQHCSAVYYGLRNP